VSTIIASVKIRKPKEEVYLLIKNMQDFPDFMRDIKSLKVIKKPSTNQMITEWKIEIGGTLLRWREEDYFDNANFRINFNMLEGNYKEYRGYWLLQNSTLGSKLTIEANFDWGLPLLEKFIGKVLENRARGTLSAMLRAIKNKAENTI
jgi:uncharacterized membrane protein